MNGAVFFYVGNHRVAGKSDYPLSQSNKRKLPRLRHARNCPQRESQQYGYLPFCQVMGFVLLDFWLRVLVKCHGFLRRKFLCPYGVSCASITRNESLLGCVCLPAFTVVDYGCNTDFLQSPMPRVVLTAARSCKVVLTVNSAESTLTKRGQGLECIENHSCKCHKS